MSIRRAIEERLGSASAADGEGLRLALPTSLKKDPTGVRIGLLRRLAGSRTFALGDRSGVLRTAQKRSGRAFRLDVRQRVIVKALVSRHAGRSAARGAALTAHVSYLGRQGAGKDGVRPGFFNGREDSVDASAATAGWAGDRHHFRFIVSPEHGERLDLRSYTREVLARVGADLGEPRLTWIATCHYDTDQPHAHVLVRGRREDGRDLVIPRDYIGYGFRARAQEVAQERLGDLSRIEAERRIWKETQADRFTGFDRRLLAEADAAGRVSDGVGRSDAWAALTRGRLRHLEGLGLAVRESTGYRLDDELETKLRGLQLRREVIRTLNQRRLETGREVREVGHDRIRGTVVRTGFHDEAAAVPWVVVRDGAGVEYYARLRSGSVEPSLGQVRLLEPLSGGAARCMSPHGTDLSR